MRALQYWEIRRLLITWHQPNFRDNNLFSHLSHQPGSRSIISGHMPDVEKRYQNERQICKVFCIPNFTAYKDMDFILIFPFFDSQHSIQFVFEQISCKT